MTQVSKVFGINTNKRQPVTDAKRRTGFDPEQVDNFDLNEILFKTRFDHIIGSAAQVASNDATIYWNSANTEFRDQDEATVTLLDGDRILWAGLDAITSDIDISTIDELEHTTDTGVTIALGVQNLLLGEKQKGFLNASSSPTDETEGNISSIDSPELTVNNNPICKLVDFESKNLIIANSTNTTNNITADSIRICDDNNNSFLIPNLSETFDITTDLNAGSEKSNTKYQHWIGCDYLGNIQRLLVPDIQGVADGTASNKLIDSTATFVTDAIQIGDIVRNLTDDVKTFVSAVDSQTSLSLDDDIFVSGEDYEINIETPQFDAGKQFRAKLGSNLNDSGSDFTTNYIFYNQHRHIKQYSISEGDFTLTGTNWTSTRAVATVYQTDGIDNNPVWKLSLKSRGTLSVGASSISLSMSGITSRNVPNFVQIYTAGTNNMVAGVDVVRGTIAPNSNVFSNSASGTDTIWFLSADEIELENKPDFVD